MFNTAPQLVSDDCVHVCFILLLCISVQLKPISITCTEQYMYIQYIHASKSVAWK